MTDRFVAELIAAIGAACLIVGVTVIYWPAGLITAGVLLITLVIAALVLDDERAGADGPPSSAGTQRR